MSFDGLMTKAVTEEIVPLLTTGRISKIYQPYKNEIILTVRANGTNYPLLLSANPSFARAQITQEKYENPKEPPMFCMLLRKHLEGAIIDSISQIDMERIIVFEVRGKDEIGDISHKKLIVEIMGRHSNIILVEATTNKIIDSIKHISLAQSSVRSIYPGQQYALPPSQEKLNPFEIDHDLFSQKIDFNSGKLDKQIIERFSGISPSVAKEIVDRAGLANRQSLTDAFFSVIEPLKEGKYHPQIISINDKEYFSIVPLHHIKGEVQAFSSVSLLLDRYYYGKADRDRVKQQANDIEKFIRNELQKNKKKIKKLEQTLVDSEKAVKYQRFGELLTANLYQVRRGDKEVEVVDYYDENGGMVTIPLDPQKSPSDNAQQYFKKYLKAKNSVIVVEEQIKLANEEISYFEQLTQQVESATPRDIEEIREELIEGGYIRRRQKDTKKKKKDIKPLVDSYTSSTGTTIVVGKNNKQNEYITNKLARQDEIWFHTKDIPGSHVVIRSIDPDDTTIQEAAMLAAYYSKAKLSSRVPVDYTKIRHVKKPNGAKPGYVIYDNQTTIYVTPDEDHVIKLKN
ncbi:Rqc2 family fibronectin-binding protein [Bacillus alkalicellulosilyticus]|uniref:Rqc2 family fibronectin-binding protein n=1 Tax=Alkalihalobacterium alkalicellulosilyticum TaxID=1912214 RepID=UPI000996E93C|nr:NFACT RNA binding domain-containing protein [Bacillus alkalicellulosilyticus]